MPLKGQTRTINNNMAFMLQVMYEELTAAGYNSTVARNKVLPDEVNIPQSTLTKLKNQNAPVDLYAIEKICQITGKTPAELFARCTEENGFTLNTDYQYKKPESAPQAEDAPNEQENQ